MSTPQNTDKLLINRSGVSYSITYQDINADATQALTDAASAQTTADAALPKAGGTMTGTLTSTAGASFGSGAFVVDSSGVVQTNTQSAGHLELDGTGAFTSSKVFLNASTGVGEFAGGVKVNSSGDILTHYEEGTWTPVFKLGTTTASGTFEGHFTRIGRMVTASCSLQFSSTNSGTGSNEVGGLPYTVGSLYSGTTVQGGGTVTYFANGGNRERPTYAFNAYQGTTYGAIFGGSNSDSNHSDIDIRLTEASFQNDSSIRIVFTYFV